MEEHKNAVNLEKKVNELDEEIQGWMDKNFSNDEKEKLKVKFYQYHVNSKNDFGRLLEDTDKIEDICKHANLDASNSRKLCLKSFHIYKKINNNNKNENKKEKGEKELPTNEKNIDDLRKIIHDLQKKIDEKTNELHETTKEHHRLQEKINSLKESISKMNNENTNGDLIKLLSRSLSLNDNNTKIALKYHSCLGYFSEDYHPRNLIQSHINRPYKSKIVSEMKNENYDSLVFKMDDENNKFDYYCLTYFKISNHYRNMGVKSVGIEIGNVETNQWFKLCPFVMDNIHLNKWNQKTNKYDQWETLKISIDSKLILNKHNRKFIKLLLFDNHGCKSSDDSKFSFYKLEMYGIGY